MKKFLKNINLIIITIVLAFSFGLKVNAVAGCEGYTSNECRVSVNGTLLKGTSTSRYSSGTEVSSYCDPSGNCDTQSVVYYDDIDVSFSKSDATVAIYEGPSRAFFCMNPQLTGYPYLEITRFLLDSTYNTFMHSMDYMLMSAMTAYSDEPDSGVVSMGILKGRIPSYGDKLNYTVEMSADDKLFYQKYFAQLAAVRAITLIFGVAKFDNGGEQSPWKDAFAAHINLTEDWVNEYSSDISKLESLMNSKGLEFGKGGAGGYKLTTSWSLAGYGKKADYIFSGDVIENGKTIFANALKDTIDYLENDYGTEASAKQDSYMADATVEKTTDDTGTLLSRNVVHTATVKGLTKDEEGKRKFVIDGIEFAGGKSYTGLTAYISNVTINGTSNDFGPGEFDSQMKGKNLLDGSFGEFENETTVKITVHFEGYEDELNCGQSLIKYMIKGSFDGAGNDAFGEYIGVIWKPKDDIEANLQNYISVEPRKEDGESSTTSTFEFEGETVLVDHCDCDTLAEACISSGDWNSEECETFKGADCEDCISAKTHCELEPDSPDCDEDKIAEVCSASVACNSYVEALECCSASDDLIEIMETDDHEVNIFGLYDAENTSNNDNITQLCFVDKVNTLAKKAGNNASDVYVTDQAGNKLSLEETKENKYCTVSCKEDYLMTLPHAKMVNAGRYFTFKASVKGTKACYTNTIDRDQYEKDIKQAQKDMVAAMNEYNEAKAIVDNIDKTVATYTGSVDVQANPTFDGQCNYTQGTVVNGYKLDYSYTSYTLNESTGQLTSSEKTGKKEDSVATTSETVYPNTDCMATTRTDCWSKTNCEWNPRSAYQGEVGYDPETAGTCQLVTSKCSSKTTSGACNSYSVCSWTPNLFGSGYCSGKSAPSCSITKAGTGDPKTQWETTAKKDLETAKGKLNTAIAKYNQAINDIKQCTSWTFGKNIDPVLSYVYSENYEYPDENMKEIESLTTNSNEEWYCNSKFEGGKETTKGEISENYTKCSTGDAGQADTTTFNYVVCSADGGCKTEQQDIPNARYAMKSQSTEKTYRPNTLFYNLYPTGEVLYVNSDEYKRLDEDVKAATKPIEEETEDGVSGGLPVALNTQRGIYRYSVKISELGEFYDNGKLGRYSGENVDEKHKSVFNFADGFVYNCAYLVNIGEIPAEGYPCDLLGVTPGNPNDPNDPDNPDDPNNPNDPDVPCTSPDTCTAVCVGPNCPGAPEECEGPDCIADCVGVGCAYDDDTGITYLERVASLNDLFPNGVSSYNWSNAKGQATKEDIEETHNGDDIYSGKPTFSVTLTPDAKTHIHDYNTKNERNGGYSNLTLTCKSLNGYANIACYSSFISDIIGMYGNDSLATSARRVEDDNTEYFTPWAGSDGGAIDIKTMIGPSWKIGG